MRNQILMLTLALTFATSGAATAQTAKDARSAFQLLPGYKVTLTGGSDTSGGRIWKLGGVSIDWNWGQGLGDADAQIGKEQVIWRESQTVNGKEIVCIYSKSKEFLIWLRVGPRDFPTIFRAKIRSQKEMTEMLLMVLSFEPHQGYPVDPSAVVPGK
jgi:hypothetical protein